MALAWWWYGELNIKVMPLAWWLYGELNVKVIPLSMFLLETSCYQTGSQNWLLAQSVGHTQQINWLRGWKWWMLRYSSGSDDREP